ncbi:MULTISPECIES: protoporphyrinogen/coproporphyrinogen oxidase [unclassified Leucobacter]|uniref:protoporphyrinogen/coproporphyrinogen oxidase n=1 Tax=unclassified Leucobacter TaxID=2621730 RepID=UPI00069A32B5|nr:FAD-dependent oxidoreductase [Leucobacter sp. Ag1]
MGADDEDQPLGRAARRAAALPAAANRGAARRVAVVGGGIAGLVAARDLALGGAEVTVIERDDRLGGKLRGERIAAWAGTDAVVADLGAEAYATRGDGVAVLLTELGMIDRIEAPQQLGSWAYDSGTAYALPPGLLGIPARPFSRAARRALGLGGALRAAIEPLLPRAVGRDERSLGGLVEARFGSRVLDRLVRPVARGVYSTDPESLPVARVAPGLASTLAKGRSLTRAVRAANARRTSAGGAVARVGGGMHRLPERLEDELRELGVAIRLGAEVVEVSGVDDGWDVQLAGETIRVDAVLLAAQLPGLVRDPGFDVEVVLLAIEDPRLDAAPRGTGLLVAGSDRGGPAAKALTHTSAKWRASAEGLGPGRHLVRLSYGSADWIPATRGLGDAAVRERAVADAAELLGVELRAGDVREMHRAVWTMPRAAAQDSGVAGAAAGTAGTVAGSTAPRVPVARTGEAASVTGLAQVIPHARAAARELLAGLSRSAERPPAPGGSPEPSTRSESQQRSHTP